MSRKKFRSGRKTLFSLLKRSSFFQTDLQIAVLIMLAGSAWVQDALATESDDWADSGAHPWSAPERKTLQQIREQIQQSMTVQRIPQSVEQVEQILESMGLDAQQARLDTLLNETGGAEAALLAWLAQLQDQLASASAGQSIDLIEAVELVLTEEAAVNAMESEWSGKDATAREEDASDDPAATMSDRPAGAAGVPGQLGLAPAVFPLAQVLGGVAVAGGAVALSSSSSGLLPATESPVNPTLPPAPLNGVALDGYIANAQIFVRTPDGLVLVGGTDEQGRYVDLNGERGLKLSAEHVNLPMVLTGGKDLSSDLPFEGEMTAPAGAQVISPLTTLVEKLIQSDEGSADAAEATNKALQIVATALGLDGLEGNLMALLTVDPIAALQSGASDPAAAALGTDLFKAGALINSMVSSIADIVAAAADDPISAVGAGLSAEIFQQIARLLSGPTPPQLALDTTVAQFSSQLLLKTAQSLADSGNAVVSIEDAAAFLDEASRKAFGLEVIIDGLVNQIGQMNSSDAVTGQVGGAQVQTDSKVDFLIKGVVTAEGPSMLDDAQDVATLIKFDVKTVKADPDLPAPVIHIELGNVATLTAQLISQNFPAFETAALVTLSMGSDALAALLDDSSAQEALRSKGIDRLALKSGNFSITPAQAETVIGNGLTFADGVLVTDTVATEAGFAVHLVQSEPGSLSDHGLTLASLARLGVDTVSSQTGTVHIKAGELSAQGAPASKLPQFAAKDSVTLGLTAAQLPDFFEGLPDIIALGARTFSTVLSTTQLNRSVLATLGIDQIALVDAPAGEDAILHLTTDMGHRLLQAGLSVAEEFILTADAGRAGRSIETTAFYLHGTQLDAQTILNDLQLTQLGIDAVVVGQDTFGAPFGITSFDSVAQAAASLRNATLVDFDRDLAVAVDSGGLSIAAVEAAIAATRLADVGDQNLLSLFDLGVDRILIGLGDGAMDDLASFDLDPDSDGFFGGLDRAG